MADKARGPPLFISMNGACRRGQQPYFAEFAKAAIALILFIIMIKHETRGEPDGRHKAKTPPLPAQEYLAAIVDSSDDAIIGKSLSGVVQSWNKGAERMLGYLAEEIVGESIFKLVPPDHIEEERMILSRLKEGRRIEHYETVRVARNGRVLDVWLTLSPIKDKRGKVLGVSSIVRDVTERKRAEALQRESMVALKRQASMLRLAPVLMRDAADRITYWNHGAERMYGWTEAEALGRVSHELGDLAAALTGKRRAGVESA